MEKPDAHSMSLRPIEWTPVYRDAFVRWQKNWHALCVMRMRWAPRKPPETWVNPLLAECEAASSAMIAEVLNIVSTRRNAHRRASNNA